MKCIECDKDMDQPTHDEVFTHLHDECAKKRADEHRAVNVNDRPEQVEMSYQTEEDHEMLLKRQKELKAAKKNSKDED